MRHRATTHRRRSTTAAVIGGITTGADTAMIEDGGTTATAETIDADEVMSRRQRDSVPGAAFRRNRSLQRPRLGSRLLRVGVPVTGGILDLSAPRGVSRADVHRTDGHLAESPGDVEHVG